MDAEEPTAAQQHVTVQGNAQTVIAITNMSGDVNAGPSSRSALPVPQELLPAVEGFHNHDETLRWLTDRGFDEARADVLAGPPGSGKTALAIHWANLVAHQFPDGRIHLNLRGTGKGAPLDVHDALGRLLQSLGRDPQGIPSDTEQRGCLWRSLSFDRKLFVLLDDAVDAEQVAPLLPNGPHTVTVITSRDALTELTELRGVRVTTVNPLAPDESVAMLRYLLGEHSDAQDDELRLLADLCGHLQLALRVAATRLLRSPLLTASELNEELVEHGRVLEPVRVVFDSAYRHLESESARLFRLLGMAPGSILAVDTVVALAGGKPTQAKRLIEDLRQNHLVTLDKDRRCVMQDLLQAYAGQLAESPEHQAEAEAGLARLGTWYAERATAAALALGSPMRPRNTDQEPRQIFDSGRTAQNWYRNEAENLTVMVTALTEHHMLDTALTLCQAVAELRAFNNATSWTPVAKKGLEIAEAFDDVAAQAFFHESLGKSSAQSGKPTQAIPFHEKALELRLRIGDLAGQARSLNALGLTAWRIGDLDHAEQQLTESRIRARAAQDVRLEALALMNLGLVALTRTHHRDALDLLDAALERLDGKAQAFYMSNALYNRALALSGLGERATADASAEQAAGLARELANPLLLAPALRVLAITKAALGDAAAAERCLTEAIEILQTLGDTGRETQFREQLARLRNPV